MDELISILNEIGLPYAYDHFAEGESPNPPFICYLLPGSDNFAADGMVYYKINESHPYKVWVGNHLPGRETDSPPHRSIIIEMRFSILRKP